MEINGKPVSILVICQKGLEEELRKLGLPDNVATAHFNAIQGLNLYSHVPKIVIAGRLLPWPTEIERMARVLTGKNVVAVGEGWYPTKPTTVRTRGTVTPLVNAVFHPDPMAEAIRHQVCEAELIQAIGRARGIRRTADNPLEIDILTNVPLPFPVDEVTTWGEVIPDDFEVVLCADDVESPTLAKGILPLTKGELARMHPDRWATPDRARYALRGGDGADGIVARFWGGETPISTLIGNLPPPTIIPMGHPVQTHRSGPRPERANRTSAPE